MDGPHHTEGQEVSQSNTDDPRSTEELKQRALASDEDHIRIRAREIWEDNGRPCGTDQEFWFQAEREFREAEDLATRAGEDA
jgi:Protein of unknown function (DUF2934)